MRNLKLFGMFVALGLSACASPIPKLSPENAVQALSGNWFGVYQRGKEHYCWLSKHAPNGSYSTQFVDVTKVITPYTETGEWTASAGMLVTIPNSPNDSAQRPARTDYLIIDYSGNDLVYQTTPGGETYKAKRVGATFVLPSDCKPS